MPYLTNSNSNATVAIAFFSLLPKGSAMPSYDPSTGLIDLGADPTPYSLAHERAHQHQARHQTRLWRLDRHCHRLPILGAYTRLLVEWQAARLALQTLALIGLRTRSAELEARAGLRSYFVACFWPL